MAVLNVLGKRVDVDIEAELRQFSWDRARWSNAKLIASSPFRDDNQPSFFVNLETGGWADSGSSGDDASGNLFTLLAELHGISTQDVCNMLIDNYGTLYDITDDTQDLQVETPKLTSTFEGVSEVDGRHLVQATSPYMSKRGISAEVQKEFAIGYGEGHKGFTAMPWHTNDGRLANIKYRSTSSKKFFYAGNATPVSSLVYGLDIAKAYDSVVIVEGEVDALSWWTAGIPAVALGGSSISDTQAQSIIREGFREIFVAGDNDTAGMKLNRAMNKAFKGVAKLREVYYVGEVDANDVLLKHGSGKMAEVMAEAREINAITLE